MLNQLESHYLSSIWFRRIFYFFLASSLIALFVAPRTAASTVPTAPQYVEAMAGPTQVAVTWDPPSSSGGENSLNYTARVWTVPPPTASPVFASCSTTDLGCVIGGLVSGSAYYVDVIAGNSAGTSAPSAMKPISPGSAGGPPINVSAVSDSKGLLTVKWSPPSVTGTGQFAWYAAEIFSSPEISAGSYIKYCTADSPSASSCLIAGLTLGKTYYVQVRTLSSLGSSYPSFPRYRVVVGSASPAPNSSGTTAAEKLTPPLGVKAVALSKAVKVSWKKPASTANKKILGYRAGAYNTSNKLLSSCKTKSTGLSCTIKKLQAKKAVRIGVVALYSGVESPRSRLIKVTPKA